MKFLYSLFFILLSLSSLAQKSILKDESTKAVVKQGLDKVYNFKFAEAKTLFLKVKEKYPNHPAYDFLLATTLYWEMLCNDSYKTQAPTYLQHLNSCLQKTTALDTVPETKVEAIFFRLAAQAYLTLYYSKEKDTNKTLKYAKNAYESYKKSVPLLKEFSEFYFTNGLYNYYVAKYPDTHPTYKPFMGFFVPGNKEKGLQDLDYASKNCVFVNTEATYYLTGIYLKYEINPDKAYPYSQNLISKFPDNLYFTARNAEVQAKLQHWDEARSQANKLQSSGKKYFIMASNLFYGIIAEKHQTNYDLASQYYNKVIESYKEISNSSTEYLSMAYLGLGRIELRKGNKTKAMEYCKLARQYAEYDDVMKEADLLIKRCA
jgi:tetratricopeptide (TPR) repeat protein